MSSMEHVLKIKELTEELNEYKATVQRLSFDLEMGKGRVPDSFIRALRTVALEQAAEYVMDWGVPKSGQDLVNLCERIKRLEENSKYAVKRASLQIQFFLDD